MEETKPLKELDFTDKYFPIPFDAPITVQLDQETGAIWIQNTQLHPSVKGGITMRAMFSPAAARELALALKRLESALGSPIEDLAKPDSVQ